MPSFKILLPSQNDLRLFHFGFLFALVLLILPGNLLAQEAEDKAEDTYISEKAKDVESLEVTAAVNKENTKNKESVVVNDNKGQPEPAQDLLTLISPTVKKEEKEEPIVATGDKIEYSADSKEVIFTGNVEVTSKGTKLTCQRLVLNNQTKDCVAEGNARLDESQGVIEGEKLVYNFETQNGTIFSADFRSNPYFGRARKVEKIGTTEYIARNGHMTTCNLDHPHYWFGSSKMDVYPEDKVIIKDTAFYVGGIPLLYLPQLKRSLKDDNMMVQVMPGNSKEWGQYLLTSMRYDLTQYLKGRIYLDYRNLLGVAEGFGFNYEPPRFGRGDFKFYYTQERDKSDDLDKNDVTIPKVFERYLVRWRHKWDIDEQTNLILEYYRIKDSKMILYPGRGFNFLKDYFYREYEKDSQPLSYVSMHHSFAYSSIDFLFQKRTNRWYTQLERLPEIKYTMPNTQLGNTPLYFENITQGAYFDYKHAVPSPSSDDLSDGRIDTVNKFSLPLRVAFIQFTPFVKNQETYYTKDVYGSAAVWRSIFYSGAELSTKFYRLFNVKTDALGLDINGLRHVITPTVSYNFNKEPTVLSSKLIQIDSIDSISRNNSVGLSLSNKLQTKRKNTSVDLVDFLVTSTYLNKPKTGVKRGSSIQDIVLDLKILPFSWLRLEADATYKRSVARDDPLYNRFSNVNYDLVFDWGKDRSLSLGQRYQLKGANEFTYELIWRLNPKWKFSLYQRRVRGHGSSVERGLQEHQYVLTRDLHCWEMDMGYDGKRHKGSTVWVIFRLKAFPEMEFQVDQSYHEPKSGSRN